MSPSGDVIPRDVYPVPAAVVIQVTVFAATIRSPGAVVVSAPLSLMVDVPVEAIAPSNGFVASTPRYSAIRTSGYVAAPLNATVTTFAAAAAPTMFFA